MSLDWARPVVHPRHAGAWREGPLALLLAASKGYIKHIHIYIYIYVYRLSLMKLWYLIHKAVVFNSAVVLASPGRQQKEP